MTTAERARSTRRERAREVASITGWELVDRRGPLDRWLAEGLLYVVGGEKEELRGADSRVAVHEGMLRSRLHTGTDHPLIATLAPSGHASRVVDATLGLAGDALHIAGALGCEVVGYEASPALHCLLVEGLGRLVQNRRPEVAQAASRVHPVLADSAVAMAQLEPDSADAVLLAPMYPNPDRAAPGFDVLRSVAVHTPLTADQLMAALRVAPRAVLKWPRGLSRPEALGAAPRLELRTGHRVDYWIATRA